MSISIVMYTQKNFYLTEALNEKISLFQAAGLIQYWHIYERKNFIDNSNPPKILTFHQLLGAFQILLCGCGISALVFIAEIIAKTKFNFLSLNLHKWMFLIFIEITINFNCSPKILKWQCDVITKAECNCCWHLCCVAMCLKMTLMMFMHRLIFIWCRCFHWKWICMHTHAFYYHNDDSDIDGSAVGYWNSMYKHK